MNKLKLLLPVFVLIVFSSPAFSQKYKRISDTAKLNKEYIEVSNEIAELTSQLTIAQNNLPGYRTKENDAASNAQTSAEESSKAASKATNGELDDAKRAKKRADEALNKAEDAKDANRRTKKQDKKIAKLESQLQKKQKRLKDLDEMKAAIQKDAALLW